MPIYFDRAAMKARAKANLKRNYWLSFAVTLLYAVLVGGVASVLPQVSYNFSFNPGSDAQADYFGGVSPAPFPETSMPDTFAAVFAIILVLFGVIFVIALTVAMLKSIFVGNVFGVGVCRYFLQLSRGQEKFGDIAHGFHDGKQSHYKNVVKGMWAMTWRILVWIAGPLVGYIVLVIIAAALSENGLMFALLLLLSLGVLLVGMIPAIVKELEFFAVPYLLAEHPEMEPHEVLLASKQLTAGHKGDIFVLMLSFIGWELLGALAFGVGTHFVAPYIQATYAEAYAVLCGAPTARVNMPFAAAPTSVFGQMQTAASEPPVVPPTTVEENPIEENSVEENSIEENSTEENPFEE